MYRQVLSQTQTQHEALLQACEVERPRLDAALRTDMDQIITSKEHVTGKIRGKSRSKQNMYQTRRDQLGVLQRIIMSVVL